MFDRAQDTGWFDALFELLLNEDEGAVIAVLRGTFGSPPAFLVPLVEDDVEPEEALAYARILAELGHERDARHILAEVAVHAAGGRPELAPALPVGAPVVAA